MVESKGDSLKIHDRPGILFVGSPSVGKRTLLHRLLSSSSSFDLSGEQYNANKLSHGWRIENKYYRALLALWNFNLDDDDPFLVSSLPFSHRIAALVVVFDVSNPRSLSAIQRWISITDLNQFDILLCVANKIDLLSSHPSQSHYQNHLRFENLPILNAPPDFESTSLLSNEVSDSHTRILSSSREWCAERNFELIEACASNPDFDNCLSLDGDSQGFERIICALSAHMWPGMVMNSRNQTAPSKSNNETDSSEEEIDYDFEYEVLTEGSGESHDDNAFGAWVGNGSTYQVEAFPASENEGESREECEVSEFETDEMEAIMSEIGNARDKVRFLPDFERREMAANLAFKMAALFGASTDDEDDVVRT